MKGKKIIVIGKKDPTLAQRLAKKCSNKKKFYCVNDSSSENEVCVSQCITCKKLKIVK